MTFTSASDRIRMFLLRSLFKAVSKTEYFWYLLEYFLSLFEIVIAGMPFSL